MAKQKNEILKALRDTHLRAIGKVAAQWSALEITILFVISKALNVSFTQATIVCGSQNASAWCDMLKKLTNESKGSELATVCKTIEDLQSKRNNIVHAYWHPRQEVANGLFGLNITPQKPPILARGIGVPKRGKEIFRQFEYAPQDILKVANEIAKAERSLFDWHSQRQKRLLLAQKLAEHPTTHQHVLV